jgi:hypothetical protein
MQIASIDSARKCFLDFEILESNKWTERRPREHYSKAFSACHVSAATTAWREWFSAFAPEEAARPANPSLHLFDDVGRH